jgi:hypothetical protein
LHRELLAALLASEWPRVIVLVLANPTYHFKRIGLEAGPLSQWLFSALAGGTLPPGACEDVTQPEAANAADPSQAAGGALTDALYRRSKRLNFSRRVVAAPALLGAPYF